MSMYADAEIIVREGDDGKLSFEWSGGRFVLVSRALLEDLGYKTVGIGDYFAIGPFRLCVVCAESWQDAVLAMRVKDGFDWVRLA